MIGLLQRVKRASVTIDNKLFSSINAGILVLYGVEKGDEKEKAEKIADKIAKLRIFEDENGKMNKSIKDISGEVLVVSQFTLAGNCAKGTRPSFDRAETPDKANEMYEYFSKLEDRSAEIKQILYMWYKKNKKGGGKEEATKDLEGLQTMRNLGKNMAYMLKCMENGRKNGIEKPEYEKGEKTNFIR